VFVRLQQLQNAPSAAAAGQLGWRRQKVVHLIGRRQKMVHLGASSRGLPNVGGHCGGFAGDTRFNMFREL
jgi:hypothetical protein